MESSSMMRWFEVAGNKVIQKRPPKDPLKDRMVEVVSNISRAHCEYIFGKEIELTIKLHLHLPDCSDSPLCYR